MSAQLAMGGTSTKYMCSSSVPLKPPVDGLSIMIDFIIDIVEE